MAKKLSRREKYSIFGVSGLIGLFILIQFIISPLIDGRERTIRKLGAKTKILEDMITLKSEYDVIKKNAVTSMSRFAKRKKNFTLFSFLDKLAGEIGLKDNITYMKPTTSSPKDSPYKISQVEMKLQNTTLKELTAYLHRIETSENIVFIKRLSISKTVKQAGFINAVLQVETSEI